LFQTLIVLPIKIAFDPTVILTPDDTTIFLAVRVLINTMTVKPCLLTLVESNRVILCNKSFLRLVKDWIAVKPNGLVF
jgi:hypothetical protein